MKLHLGCSDNLMIGYTNVDILSECPAPLPDGALYQQADLNAPWPWEDSSVDQIQAFDVFEHLTGPGPQNRGKVWVMNESWRVLKPGGKLIFGVPCVYLSDGRVNPGAFADPTHATYWTLDDAFYFGSQFNTREFERGRLGDAYGIKAVFEFPPAIQMAAGWTWRCRNGLGWELLSYGKGSEQRSKIMAALRAVK